MRRKAKIGVIGFGKMARIIIGRALAQKVLSRAQVLVLRHHPAKDRQIQKKWALSFVGLKELFEKCDVILLAVKPQQMAAVLQDIKNHYRGQLIITVAAGIPVKFYQKILGKKPRLIRLMPNTPAKLGLGAFTLFAPRHVSKSDQGLCTGLMAPCGQIFVIKNENKMHATTTLAGSAPAFVFAFAEALIAAGQKMGLTKALSRALVNKTLTGSAMLLEKSADDPAALIAEVASKKGMTEAGLKVLEKKRFTQILMECMQKTQARSRELGRIYGR